MNVLHVDENENYGGDYASLTVSELTAWAEQRSSPSSGPPTTYLSSQRSRFSQIEVSSPTPPVLAKQRAFSLSLSPLLIPSLSPLIQTLIDSGTSRYSTFRLLESSSIYARDAEGEGPGKATKVPGCKEDVFTDKAIGLVDKRRLMKVLMWCAGEFEESKEILGELHQLVGHGLALTPFPLFCRLRADAVPGFPQNQVLSLCAFG